MQAAYKQAFGHPPGTERGSGGDDSGEEDDGGASSGAPSAALLRMLGYPVAPAREHALRLADGSDRACARAASLIAKARIADTRPACSLLWV
jgi:hypothetical protein